LIVPSHADHPFASVLHNIGRAPIPSDIRSERERLRDLAERLMSQGVSVHRLTGYLSDVGEAVVGALVRRSLMELGPAPAGFAFVVMGSLCRRELTLNADQDNAIVYRDEPPESGQSAGAYFLELGGAVCRGLDEAGYPLCKGDFMAQNPQWCQPVSVWKGYYSQWILGFDPEAQVRFGMFFDFREAYGDTSLTHALRAHLHGVLADSRGFLYHLSRIARNYEMPLSRFGNLKTTKMQGFRDLLDIKSAAEPIVFIARLLAYRNGIEATHTLSRLEALGELRFLEAHTCRAVIQAYTLLMTIRLQHQLTGGGASLPENFVRLGNLGGDDRFMLKEALRAIRALQSEL
jgi:CBS domain-containing protein